MSARYVPRHARPAQKSEKPGFLGRLTSSNATDDHGGEALEPTSVTETTPAAKATAADAPDQTLAPVLLPDNDLAVTIAKATAAVQEHPELAFPLIEPTQLFDPEQDPRLATLRRRRWPITIAIILVIILVSGVIIYGVLASQAAQRESNRSQGYVLLDEAIALIQQSDPEVIALDSAVRSEVTESDLPQRKVILEKVPATLDTLASASDKATSALGLFMSAEDKELAQHVIDAAVNRVAMLQSGQILLDTDIKAMNSTLAFVLAWDLMVKADSDMRVAAELSKAGGYYDVMAAVDANTGVLELLTQANDLMLQAIDAFPEVDFEVINTYLALKMDSVRLAIESDQALLDADLETAYAKNVEFSQKDAAVVAAASRIPAESLSLITTAYDKVTAESKQLYDSARGNAADADVFVREYVGVETQAGVETQTGVQ
ncbi:MAG: hypothetical protein LBC35_00610 [Coriobacteriales bacterium]|jgi:hypothetical protein|nr:hypothetical protein [Coriobacteriales bacterium]